MSKTDRILAYLPAFYRAGRRGKLLYEVVESLATPVIEADTSLFRIQRAHRLKVAEESQDVLRLAAALNLTPFHFEDITSNTKVPYEERLAQMRERIVRIARVHLAGLGTPVAIMEAAAIFLNARLIANKLGTPAIRHIDPERYSHEANLQIAGAPESSKLRLALHENPLARRKSNARECQPLDHWPLENRGAEPAPLILTITGVGDRTVCPEIFSPASGEGIAFNGVVPDGRTLRIDARSGAYMDDVPVDAWISYYRGAQQDYSSFDQGKLAEEQGSEGGLFSGNPDEAANNPAPARLTPRLPIGQSEWYFKVPQGVYDGARFDGSVYHLPDEPVGVYDSDPVFDASSFELPASAVVAAGWDERQRCAFKVILPAQLAAGAAEGAANPVNRIASILPRFKAAGIRAYVDIARPAWILGEGILRRADAAEGAGIASDSTILRSSLTDLYVDTEAAL